MNNIIGFVGGGNMAEALVHGLTKAGYKRDRIWVYDLHEDKLDHLKQSYGINTTIHLTELCRYAEIIILAVKPQSMKVVAEQIKLLTLNHNAVVLSIAAGISIDLLQQWLGQHVAIIRSMPNKPALIQQGITGVYAGINATENQKMLADTILQCVGQVLWVNQENDLNQVTAVSGSGPAYFFYCLELLEKAELFIKDEHLLECLVSKIENLKSPLQNDEEYYLNEKNKLFLFYMLAIESVFAAAVKIGLSADNSFQLTKQTAIGSIRLVEYSSDDLALLRQKVTSKGGTTAAAMSIFEHSELKAMFQKDREIDKNQINNIKQIFYEAIFAAWQQSLTLSFKS